MSFTDLRIAYGTKSITSDYETGKTAGFDKEGNCIFEDYDADHNGFKESSIVYGDTIRQEFSYNNENGNLLSKTTYDKDTDELLEAFNYEYDNKGKLIKEHKDCGGDGTIDYTTDYRNVFQKLGSAIADIFKE